MYGGCYAGWALDAVVPCAYRFLEEDRPFRKYQWIEVQTTRASSDHRPESLHLNEQSIQIVGSIDRWPERRRFLQPLVRQSLCQIEQTREEYGSPTLGIFKPKIITGLAIESTNPHWTAEQATF